MTMTRAEEDRLREIERCARGLVRTAHPEVTKYGVVREWWDALRAVLDRPPLAEQVQFLGWTKEQAEALEQLALAESVEQARTDALDRTGAEGWWDR